MTFTITQFYTKYPHLDRTLCQLGEVTIIHVQKASNYISNISESNLNCTIQKNARFMKILLKYIYYWFID